MRHAAPALAPLRLRPYALHHRACRREAGTSDRAARRPPDLVGQAPLRGAGPAGHERRPRAAEGLRLLLARAANRPRCFAYHPIDEVAVGARHVGLESDGAKPPRERLRLPEHLDDAELAAVVESPRHDAR